MNDEPNVSKGSDAPSKRPDRQYRISTTRNFNLWMFENQCSLSFSAYHAGLLFLLGNGPDGKLTKSTHNFSRCMGICGDSDKIWAASLHQIWRFSNHVDQIERSLGHDRIYRPRVAYVTGDMDIHEMAETGDGELIFVNTLFSCLAKLSDRVSFEPVWKPAFISKLAAEDRCHLNGLAMRDGKPYAVTALGRTDVAQGWRDHRTDGGVIIDVASNEIVASGLSMPHSPRWAFGKLWVINSGTGGFGYIDSATGKFEEVAFCPGYGRGMTIHGRFAIVGLSTQREKSTFGDLPLDERLSKNGVKARCGLMIIDLETGSAVESLRIEGSVQELFGVIALPGVRNPALMGDPVRQTSKLVTVPDNTKLT